MMHKRLGPSNSEGGMFRSAWLVGLVLALLSTSAPAQNVESARSPCREDAKILCTNVQVGGGMMVSCLTSQKDKLSDPCRKALEVGANQKADPWSGIRR